MIYSQSYNETLWTSKAPHALSSTLLFVLLPAAALSQSLFSSHLLPFNFFQSETAFPLGGRRWELVECEWMQHERSFFPLSSSSVCCCLLCTSPLPLLYR